MKDSEPLSTIRDREIEDRDSLLTGWAQLNADTRGRENPEPSDDLRIDYQLDRDRILYDRAFRRLKFKTQVFIEPVNDDTRTRLTHTLEVMQVARTVARVLHLNEDLVEAIALGHDIGHTPFAHVGESALNELHPNGFHHSRQSLRVVDRLARRGEGLNLTKEVRDGIVKHSKSKRSMFESIAGPEPITAEGLIVRYCESVAYLNHDIDDAIRAGHLNPEDHPKIIYEELPFLKEVNTSDIVSDFLNLQSDLTTIKLYKKHKDEPLEHLPDY